MYPILFKFGFIQIYSYGLMVALAFWVCAFLLSKQTRLLGVEKDFFWNMSGWLLLGGILGGRLLYIIFNLNYFWENPREILSLWQGGLIWYGALAGGALSGIIYLKLKKVKVIKALDLIMPFAALGQAIGRIGCFLNGCCFGSPALSIPVQLISSFNLTAIFITLRLLQEKKHKEGDVLVIYLLLSSFERFMLEFLRNDSARPYAGLTIFQVISIVIFLGAVFLWIIISRLKKRIPAEG